MRVRIFPVKPRARVTVCVPGILSKPRPGTRWNVFVQVVSCISTYVHVYSGMRGPACVGRARVVWLGSYCTRVGFVRARFPEPLWLMYLSQRLGLAFARFVCLKSPTVDLTPCRGCYTLPVHDARGVFWELLVEVDGKSTKKLDLFVFYRAESMKFGSSFPPDTNSTKTCSCLVQ